MKLTGAEVMVKCLQAEGVCTIFGYPGGAISPSTMPCVMRHRSAIS